MATDDTSWTWKGLRHRLAAAALDTPRYEAMLRPQLAALLGMSWVDLHNRGERLLRRQDQRGVLCNWRWTSTLYFCQERPEIGRRLLRLALAEWPVEFSDAPNTALTRDPDVSFVIGHRGVERTGHLLATIASIAAQKDVGLECVVVEQDWSSTLEGVLPRWVRHILTPPPEPDMPYSRSWAFNVGAKVAQGRYLVFHDNDVCVPTRYAAELMRVFKEGFEAARLQRFVFYLAPEPTAFVLSGHSLATPLPSLEVVQNCEGHTLGVRRDAYWAVGGHDEAFLGWGGEDNEIFDRLRSRHTHDHSYLPFLHLYHRPQPGKNATHANSEYFEARMRIPASERIAELSRQPFGRSEGPRRPQAPGSGADSNPVS